MESIGNLVQEVIKGMPQISLKGISLNELVNQAIRDPDVQRFLEDNKDKLNKQIVIASISNIFEFYEQKHNKDKVIVGYYPELFLNGNVIDVRYAETAEKKKQDEERIVQKRVELIDLPQKLRSVDLNSIDITSERNKALAKIGVFLKEYPKNPHAKGVYLTGNFGVGKTYMMAGMANKIAAIGKKVIFLHMPTFISGLTSHFGDNSLQNEIDRVAGCDVLILDDIGAETLSQWSRDDVLGVILQFRMDNSMPTFFTSNIDMANLESHFEETRNAIDPVKAKRLMERIRYLAEEVVVGGPNRRNG